LIASWRKGSGRVADAAEKAVEEEPPPPETFVSGPLMKSCFVILGLTALGVAIWNCTDKWSASNTVDRGMMISSIFAAFRQAAAFGTDALESILRYGKGKYSTQTEQLLQKTLDDAFKDVTGDVNAVAEPGVDGLYALPKKNFAVQVDLAEEMQNDPDAMAAVPEGEEANIYELLDEEAAAAVEGLNGIVRMKAAFNIARNALQVFGYIVSIAVAIFMTWQLIQDWQNMDDGHRAFQTIQVVLACLEAGFSLFMLGATVVYWGAGVIAGWGTSFAVGLGSFITAASAVFAAFTIVLAVIAVIVLVALFIWESKQPPPMNDVEIWMQKTGQPFADKLTPAPLPPCKFDWNPKSINSNKGDNAIQSVGFSFTNPSSTPLTVDYLQISFESGIEASCLFWDQKDYVDSKGQPPSTAGQAALISTNNSSQAVMNIVNHPSDVQSKDVTQTDISLSGPLKTDPTTGLPSSSLTLAGYETVTIYLYGRVWSAQAVDCFVSVEQGWSSDSETDDYAVHKTQGS